MELAWVPANFLVFFRALGFFLSGPLLARREVPVRIKVAAAVALTMALIPIAAQRPITPPGSLPETLLAVATESLLGAVLGLAAFLPFAGVLLAGHLMGIQMGISLGGVIDPSSGHSGGLMERLLELAALLIFVLADGHHILIRALAFSLELHPVGALGLRVELGSALASLGATVFVVALEVGGAVLGVLFLAEAAMGFVARSVPQMNIFVLGLPVKIALGLAATALTMPLFVSTLHRIFSGMEGDLLTLLRGM